MQRRPDRARLLFILLLALGLRLIGIATRPIWYDDAYSTLFAEQGLEAMLYGTLASTGSAAADVHPLGYYTLLWLWMKAFGHSLPVLRSLSVLAGLGTVYLTYRISRESFDETAGLAAALIVAILGFQVHFSQEIRMYAFLAFWLTLATYALLKKSWILFAIAAALAQYTHNLAAFYLIPLALTPLIRRDWKSLLSVTLAGVGALILYAPWLIQLPAQFAKVQNYFWVERPGAERLFTLLLYFLPNLPLADIWLVFGLALATLIFALAIYQTYLANRLRIPGFELGLWFAYLAFTPPLLLWLVSQWVPLYIERALLPSHVMFCIWLAWALTRTHLPRAVQLPVYVLIIAAAVVGLYQHVTYHGFPYGPYDQLDKSLRERIEPGDVIVHSNKLTYLPALYFDRELDQSTIADPAGSETDTLAPATRQMLGLNVAEDVESATEAADRVWLVIFQQSIDEFRARGKLTHPHVEYLQKHFLLQSVEQWSDLRLYLFIHR